jgi:hypothetical protein
VGQGSPLRDLCLGMDILAISIVTDVYITAVTRQPGTGSSIDPSRATSACAPGRRTGAPTFEKAWRTLLIHSSHGCASRKSAVHCLTKPLNCQVL